MKIAAIIFGAVAALMVGLFAMGIIGNTLSTASSVATAPGRVVQRTMETDNIINNYEWFHQQHANFQTRVSQVRQFKALMDSETVPAEKTRLRIDLAAIQQSCRDAARTYNARATMTNRSIFMGQEAPPELNASLCE